MDWEDKRSIHGACEEERDWFSESWKLPDSHCHVGVCVCAHTHTRTCIRLHRFTSETSRPHLAAPQEGGLPAQCLRCEVIKCSTPSENALETCHPTTWAFELRGL